KLVGSPWGLLWTAVSSMIFLPQVRLPWQPSWSTSATRCITCDGKSTPTGLSTYSTHRPITTARSGCTQVRKIRGKSWFHCTSKPRHWHCCCWSGTLSSEPRQLILRQEQPPIPVECVTKASKQYSYP